MKDIIFKYRWLPRKLNKFVEFGIDSDNNRYLLGVSSEIEYIDCEVRKRGIVKIIPKEIYIRIWILHTVFSLGTGEISIERKSRNRIKILLGIAGI